MPGAGNTFVLGFSLRRNRLAPPSGHGAEEEQTVQSPLSVGQFAGQWCSYNAPPDLPYDQREEDGGSLVFDSDVLTERVEILGAPACRRMKGRDISHACSPPQSPRAHSAGA